MNGYVKIRFKYIMTQGDIIGVSCCVIDSDVSLCGNTKNLISNLFGQLDELTPSELNTIKLDWSFAINKKLLLLMNKRAN
jgi:hypothetical protein